MKIIVKDSGKDLSLMIAVIKIAIIVFIAIIIYVDLPNYYINLKTDNNNNLILYNTISLMLIAAVFYASWMIINKKVVQSINVFRISWLLENIFFIFIISVPIFLSYKYENEYKYLFLLLITASVIQYGSKYGTITAIFSSFFTLGCDLAYSPLIEGVNISFQKDIIFTGIVTFISWVFGFYVDIEIEKSINNEKELRVLSDELESQNAKRRDIEELLIKNKVCYDILFENSQNAILVHDEGKIIYANESAARLLKYENSMQLINASIYNHYYENNISSIKENYLNINNNKLSKVIYEEDIINCNGKTILVRNTSSFFIHEGKASILTFLFDMTSEQQLKTLKHDVENNLRLLNESREFNGLITEFFTNISHELKTPVNVIYTAIQTMDLYLEDYNVEKINKCKKFIKTTKQNCFRIIRLVNNLLDITKVDCGFMKLDKKNGNIVSVVEDITQSVATYVKSKNLKLIFDTNVEEKVMAFDHDKIERIMLNLLSNAYKYSNSDGKIKVYLESREKDVEITVKDEGDGIPKEKLDIIFERFGQVNRSLSRKSEGSGIGLYLVKSFVEMHHGVINVKSIEGKGTVFKIVLPIEVVKEEAYSNRRLLGNDKVETINIEFSDIYSISTC